jgi:uncharacterized protein
MVKPRTLHHITIVNSPRENVFRFFATLGNLNLITPPQFSMQLLWMSTRGIQLGTVIDYKIKVSGIPLKWRTKITAWDPPHRFVDVQLRGPYKIWIHEHVFEEEGNRTVIHDRLQYLSPGWILEPLIDKWYIREQVASLFDYRARRLHEIFP